jgi:tetratricopeptide (TPR) repeat protein
VHSLVDHFVMFPAVGGTVTILLAVLLGQLPERSKKRFFHPIWLLVPGVMALLLGIYSLRAEAANRGGLQAASAEDWEVAAEEFSLAVDQDPGVTIYKLHAGFAYGMLAAGANEDVLQQAIAYYEEGISIDPSYGLNYANLGALYWQVGDKELAVENLSTAVELAPRAGLYWLNLGYYLEMLGDSKAAYEAYFSALTLLPDTAGSFFWQHESLRQKVLDDWLENPQRIQTRMSDYNASIESARKKIATGDLQTAEEDLIRSWKQNDQSVGLYLAFGELERARGNFQTAQQYLDVAMWIQTQTQVEKVWVLLEQAEIAVLLDQEEDAFELYKLFFLHISEYGLYGWGSHGWTPYAWFVHRRPTLPLDVLPQVLRADIPMDAAQRLYPLVAMYEQRGELEEAGRVSSFIAGALP